MGRLSGAASWMRLVAAALAIECAAQTPDELPRLHFEELVGCADIFVVAVGSEGSTFLWVDADVEALGLERGRERSFDLDGPPPGLKVAMDVYAEPPLIPEYCADFITAERPIARWTAVAGRITVTLRDRDAVRSEGVWGPGTYEAIVVLEDLALENDAGQRITAETSIEITAVVGWRAG